MLLFPSRLSASGPLGSEAVSGAHHAGTVTLLRPGARWQATKICVVQAQGWPWVVRKTCSKFGQHATDIVQQQGQTLTIATLNAKGVWLRRYTEGKELSQPNAAGVVCKTTACWEGENGVDAVLRFSQLPICIRSVQTCVCASQKCNSVLHTDATDLHTCFPAGKVHKSRMQAKNGDTWETWRYLEAGVMVVKSIFTDSRGRSATLLCTDYSVASVTHGNKRACAALTGNMHNARMTTSSVRLHGVRCSQGHMYWYFEAIRAPAAHVAADQRRVVRVAGADTARLQVRSSTLLARHQCTIQKNTSSCGPCGPAVQDASAQGCCCCLSCLWSLVSV